MAPFEVQWEAPEYEYREKDVSWYWISVIAAAAVIAFAVYERNFLFGLFIVVAEILFIVWGNRMPRTVRFAANTDGITIAHENGERERSYSFKEFDSMSASPQGDGWTELILIFHAKLKAPLKCLIPDARLVDLRAGLRTVLREVPYEPTLIDSIEKLLRF